MGLWTFWSFSLLAFVLMHHFQPKFVAQAELSSAGTNDRLYRLEVTQLEARVTQRSKVSLKVDNRTKVLSAFETETPDAEPNHDKQVEKDAQSGLEAPIGVKTAPNYHRLKIPGKKYGDTYEDNQRRRTATIISEKKIPDPRKRGKRSVDTAHTENVERSTSGQAQLRERFVETVHGGSNSRAEYRRVGEEARGSNPRQSEPHLDTSTFALSGDSAHNQAMVHWSGHNSSVSFSFRNTLTSYHKDFKERVISPHPD